MEETGGIVSMVLSGAIGLGYLTYGRRQHAIVPLVIGIALIVVPYFIPNTYLLVGICALITAIPYFIRI